MYKYISEDGALFGVFARRASGQISSIIYVQCAVRSAQCALWLSRLVSRAVLALHCGARSTHSLHLSFALIYVRRRGDVDDVKKMSRCLNDHRPAGIIF
jgi:hypothetical protein